MLNTTDATHCLKRHVNTDHLCNASGGSLLRADDSRSLPRRSVQRASPAWLTLLSVLVVNLLAAPAPAALLFYEGFDYPKGEELGDTILSSQNWENDKSQFKVGAGNLDFAGLRRSTGNHLDVTATSPSLDSVRTVPDTWPAQSTGDLYISFLLRVESADQIAGTGDGTSVLTLSRAANNTQLLGINLLNHDGIKLGILKYPSTNSRSSAVFFSTGAGANLAADGSVTYLVVAKYKWVDGPDNDVVTVWVNPAGLGGAEDPDHRVSTDAGADGNQMAGRLTLSRGPDLTIDEIRIGQTWADVTPTSGLRRLANTEPMP